MPIKVCPNCGSKMSAEANICESCGTDVSNVAVVKETPPVQGPPVSSQPAESPPNDSPPSGAPSSQPPPEESSIPKEGGGEFTKKQEKKIEEIATGAMQKEWVKIGEDFGREMDKAQLGIYLYIGIFIGRSIASIVSIFLNIPILFFISPITSAVIILINMFTPIIPFFNAVNNIFFVSDLALFAWVFIILGAIIEVAYLVLTILIIVRGFARKLSERYCGLLLLGMIPGVGWIGGLFYVGGKMFMPNFFLLTMIDRASLMVAGLLSFLSSKIMVFIISFFPVLLCLLFAYDIGFASSLGMFSDFVDVSGLVESGKESAGQIGEDVGGQAGEDVGGFEGIWNTFKEIFGAIGDDGGKNGAASIVE